MPTSARFQTSINHQAERKRTQKSRPFDEDPEVCTRLAHAGQSNANAPVRRVAAEDCPSFVGNDSEDPRFKQTCTQVQVLR